MMKTLSIEGFYRRNEAILFQMTFALSIKEPIGEMMEAYKSWGLRNGSDTTWKAPLQWIRKKMERSKVRSRIDRLFCDSS